MNLVSIDVAAERLGVSDRSVRAFIRKGELPAVRLAHNVVRFRPEDLEAFIDARTTIGGAV